MKKKLFIPIIAIATLLGTVSFQTDFFEIAKQIEIFTTLFKEVNMNYVCLLYTSPSPRDRTRSRMPSSA